MKRTAPVLLFAARLALTSAAAADPTRVLVDIGPIDDDRSRATAARLSAELSAAGFDLTTAEDAADVRATLVARDGRLVLYLELPTGATMLVRADDVPPAEAPSVLALRAVERLRAGLSTPDIAPPLPAATPSVPPPKTTKPPPQGFFVRRHLLVGGALSFDGGAVSVAPTIAFGIGIGRDFFVRGLFWGPSTNSVVESNEGRAAISSFGGRVDVGFAFPIRMGMALGGSVGLGVGRYSIMGEASPGFVPRAAVQPVFLTAGDIFFVQRLFGPLHLDVDLGAHLAWPLVIVQIGGKDAAELGFPELRARVALGFAF